MTDEIPNDIKLWGEYEDSSSSKSRGKTANNNEHDVIINSIKNRSQKKYFFNPECQSTFIPVKKEMEFIKLDNAMKDIIKMLKYRDEMKDTVEKLKLKRDVDQLSKQISNMPVPRLLTDGKENTTSKQLPIHHESNFMNGIWNQKPPTISSESALNTLSVSVATILAYTGFSETTLIPLQVLTEIAEEYIMKMLRLLKYNVEKEKLKGESGFCDVVDRTFHEMGIGSMKNLIIYYQRNIIDYKKKKTKEVEDELCVCENIIEKIKEEQKHLNGRSILLEDEHSGIPELHVTSMMGNEILSGSFETGLQMLHTIENQQLTEVENSSMVDFELTTPNEYSDAKAAKRKKK